MILTTSGVLVVRAVQGQADADYKSFMAELGGGPPPPSGSYSAPGDSRLRPGLGSVPSRGRPGDELPDDCKLYVSNLTPTMNDDALKVRCPVMRCRVTWQFDA